MLKECEGCELNLKNCAMRKGMLFVLQHKKDYVLCPCMECIVKVPCRKNCDILNTYYHNLICLEQQLQEKFHAKRM